MKNVYRIEGETAYIQVVSKGEVFEILMDVEDLGILEGKSLFKFTRHFGVNINRKPRYIHRLIMNAPEGKVVDHINRDTRDNRKSNLRICTQRENILNASSKPRSGFRNVYYSVRDDNYFVKVANKYCGKFDTAEEANEFAIDLRNKLIQKGVV